MAEIPQETELRGMAQKMLKSYNPGWLRTSLIGKTRNNRVFHEILGRAYHAGLHGLQDFTRRGTERREGREKKTGGDGEQFFVSGDLTALSTDRRTGREQRKNQGEFEPLGAGSTKIDALAKSLLGHDTMKPVFKRNWIAVKRRQRELTQTQRTLIITAMVTAYKTGFAEKGKDANPAPRSPRGVKKQ
ncbi:MAG: hypothetical protein ABH863_05980 [Candidatus Micrarchaeota archaeon]